jgi:hypothetical protein
VATDAVNRFYRRAGEETSFDPLAVITVAECLSRSASPGPSHDGLTAELRGLIQDAATGLAVGRRFA